MTPIRCPYCGAPSMEAAARNDGSFVCVSCGKAVEPPPARRPPAPPDDAREGGRWSAGPPAESASRWSSVAPLGDDESSPSISASLSSILPRGEEEPRLHQNAPGRPAWSPLVWTLLVIAIFLAALIGVVILARNVKPWWDARREADRRATAEYWWPALDNGPPSERQAAVREIVGLGPAAVVETLEHISNDAATEDRFRFVNASVHALAAEGPDISAGLAEGLKAPQAKVRAAAAAVLQQMRRAGRGNRDDLLRALGDDDRRVRFAAMDALGSLGDDGGPAAGKLAELAASHDSVAQRHAIDALAHIGPAALEALPAVEKIASEDPDAMIRGRAALAAKQIDVQRLAGKARRESGRPLKELLQSVLGEDRKEALAAAKKLGKMGMAATPAAAGLAAMLHRDDPALRAAAAAALGEIGLGAADFAPTLETAIGDDDAAVRAAAAKALEAVNDRPK